MSEEKEVPLFDKCYCKDGYVCISCKNNKSEHEQTHDTEEKKLEIENDKERIEFLEKCRESLESRLKENNEMLQRQAKEMTRIKISVGRGENNRATIKHEESKMKNKRRFSILELRRHLLWNGDDLELVKTEDAPWCIQQGKEDVYVGRKLTLFLKK